MRLTVSILFALMLCLHSNAQLSTYEWSSKVGTSSTAKKSLIDGNGNIYVWVTAAPPITIGSSTYTNTDYDNYLVKYSSTGSVIWSKEIRARMFNMCLTKDSSSLLVSGLLTSAYVNYDLGNGVSTGGTYNSAGIVYKIDGATGNSVWVKTFDATLPSLSNAVKIDAVYETNNGIFCVQGLKIRRLDTNGNEIWNKAVTANGTTYTLANSGFNSWADDNGNTFFMGYSDNSNTTTVSLNNVTYTTTANQFRTQFSLDSSGNTNWFYTNMNFNPKTALEVTKDGYVFMAGDYTYFNGFGFSNHPFIPNYCNQNYNIFKGTLKTGKPVWSSFSFIQNKAHLGADGNLYLIATRQSAGVDFVVGTTSKNHVSIASTNYLYGLRVNQAGIQDSVFTVATLASNASAGIVNFYRTNQGKLVTLFNRNNAALVFNNGNANTNTSTTAYQGLVQFMPAATAQRHSTTWTGTAADGSWFTANNWSNGVPTDTSNVIFPAGLTSYPTTNNNYYNFSTAKWAKCGYLKVASGVSLLLGYGVLVDGIIENDGALTFFYNISGGGGNYNMWSSNQSNGNIVGKGSVTLNCVDGMYYNLYRTGSNKININLFNATDKIYFSNCTAMNSINMQKGNLDFSQTTMPYLNVDSLLQFTQPARVLNASITSRAMPNIPVAFPVGNASNIQQATITLQNTTQDSYLTASFSSTVTGSAPNPSTCVVNGQGIDNTLNGGMWTITAATPLQSGAYYSANFKLKGSTNAINASRYALLKRNNSSSNWEVAGNFQPAIDSASYAISSATNITSFSDFAIGIATGVLPIYSVKLSVVAQAANNKLNWYILADDAGRIELQKSVDGIQFSTLVQLNYVSAGSYYDLGTTQKTYFRLKVIGRNGQSSYSNIVWVDAKKMNAVQVYPTIFKESFTVQNNYGRSLQMIMFTLDGKLAHQQQLLQGTNQISASGLANGNYIYQIVDGKERIDSGKLMKY